jgi:hypothetical protein
MDAPVLVVTGHVSSLASEAALSLDETLISELQSCFQGH